MTETKQRAGLNISSHHSHWSEMPDMQREGGRCERGRQSEEETKKKRRKDTDKREKKNCESIKHQKKKKKKKRFC